MGEKRIVVPEGMLKVASKAYPDPEFDNIDGVHYGVFTRPILEAALRWLSENPIVPTEEQAQYMYDGKNGLGHAGTIRYCMIEWQRRMFLAPEPEMIGEETLDRFCARFRTIGEAALEAYRLGQQSREK